MSAPLVVLMIAESPEEAQVVAALLRARDVPVYIGGAELLDEFGTTQRALGLGSVKIEVPEDHLERAREVLDAARREGERIPDEQGEDG